MFALDLHTHTRFFHSFPSRPTPFDPVGARLLGAVVTRQGLDGVALRGFDGWATARFGGGRRCGRIRHADSVIS